jgi:malic enzyme
MDQPRIEVRPTVRIDDDADLAQAYTPGVADACQAIADDPTAARQLTTQGNSVAVISAVVATGRSDHPNQINNVLVFPGVFRGLLDARARELTTAAQIAAAHAIADTVSDGKLDAERIVPSLFDERLVHAVAQAVAAEAGPGKPAR